MPISANQKFVCFTWFERDRKNVRLETEDGKEVFCLWDDDVDSAIEDGYLESPRRPRPSDEDWLEPAIQYATSMGLISENVELERQCG